MLRRVQPLLWIASIAGAIWLIFPFGFPNYDTIYALLWGDELAHGISPDYGAPLPPTPHPLVDLWGALLSPLGANVASDATTVVAYLVLGAIVYLVYRLGALWFDRPIGLIAAAIVLTREDYLSNGLRAYVDLPYIALALSALLVEARQPRAGWPVLALLGLAGLLRPEAWLFSATYLAYLMLERDPERGGLALRRRAGLDRRRLAGWFALAASAPVVWALFDLITTGDLLYSFTGTRDTVDALNRQTGLADLIRHGPPLLGEVMQWPGAIGGAGGLVLCLAFLRRRSLTGAAAFALALAAFSILAIAGLAVLPRYMMLAAAVLAIFCAAGLLGWRLLAPDHRWRRPWQLFAAATAVVFVIYIPNDLDLLSDVHTDLHGQSRVEGDLHKIVDSVAFRSRCGPISVPNFRLVPWLAIWLDRRPTQIDSPSKPRPPRRGYFLNPVDQFVVHHLLLDAKDPRRISTKPPTGLRLIARNRSWRLYSRC